MYVMRSSALGFPIDLSPHMALLNNPRHNAMWQYASEDKARTAVPGCSEGRLRDEISLLVMCAHYFYVSGRAQSCP